MEETDSEWARRRQCFSLSLWEQDKNVENRWVALRKLEHLTSCDGRGVERK